MVPSDSLEKRTSKRHEKSLCALPLLGGRDAMPACHLNFLARAVNRMTLSEAAPNRLRDSSDSKGRLRGLPRELADEGLVEHLETRTLGCHEMPGPPGHTEGAPDLSLL